MMMTTDSTTSNIGLVMPPNICGRSKSPAPGGTNSPPSASHSARNWAPSGSPGRQTGRRGNRHDQDLTYLSNSGHLSVAPLAPRRGAPELAKYSARTISAALGQEGRAYYLGMACGVAPHHDPNKV